jgi:hypothetical protein
MVFAGKVGVLRLRKPIRSESAYSAQEDSLLLGTKARGGSGQNAGIGRFRQ